MTLVVIGPATHDLIVIESESREKIGGATYFQSFVFEEFFPDYMAFVNCSDESIAREFPDSGKVKIIKKDDTHFFINEYPERDNPDVRMQLSNFADIPVMPDDLEGILPEEIDAFVLNPLNRFDFPMETIEYLKSFNVPIFLSVQGFLRIPSEEVNGNYTIKLSDFDELDCILGGASSVFMDEAEAAITGVEFDADEIVITDGSHGSRILAGEEIRIGAVRCANPVDTTGCGDTYMAAYISQKLMSKSPETAGNFASRIASEKIENFGPYIAKKQFHF